MESTSESSVLAVRPSNDEIAIATESGLYAAQHEHDACGVGFVAHIKGQKAHSIVTQGLKILENLDHRGAVGADKLMGDGAGILIQIPDEFYRADIAAQGIELPPPGEYGVVTLHRPANVDEKESLSKLIGVFAEVSRQMPLIFPIHPRTRARIESFGLNSQLEASPNIRLAPPLGYLDFLALTSQAKVIVTDSGGLQEESTVLGVPCLTVRPNTERPITCTEGTNRLVRPEREAILKGAKDAVAARPGKPPVIDRWDGRTAERIAAIVCDGAAFDSWQQRPTRKTSKTLLSV